jgi:hypothetical protein
MPLSEGSASAVPVTAQNADKHARLQALKSGANRQQMQSLAKAKSAQNSFEGIPEPTQRRRPSNAPGEQIAADKKVAVQNFQASAPVNGEFAAMEAMFGGGASPSAGAINMNMSAPVNTTQPDLTVNQEGYGPDFNPSAMIAQKRAAMKNSSEYMQYAVNPEQQMQQQTTPAQQNFDFKYMQQMMEEIAKNTISEVLNSYTEKNKNKLTYESAFKSKDGNQIVKSSDGQYYKMVPVKIKK